MAGIKQHLTLPYFPDKEKSPFRGFDGNLLSTYWSWTRLLFPEERPDIPWYTHFITTMDGGLGFALLRVKPLLYVTLFHFLRWFALKYGPWNSNTMDLWCNSLRSSVWNIESSFAADVKLVGMYVLLANRTLVPFQSDLLGFETQSIEDPKCYDLERCIKEI